MLLFDVPFNGSVAVFALGAGLFLFVVLGLGCSSRRSRQNVGQTIQTAFFFLLPQILLSGIIFPLEAIPWAVRWISYFLPLTCFNDDLAGRDAARCAIRFAVVPAGHAHRHGGHRLHRRGPAVPS